MIGKCEKSLEIFLVSVPYTINAKMHGSLADSSLQLDILRVSAILTLSLLVISSHSHWIKAASERDRAPSSSGLERML